MFNMETHELRPLECLLGDCEPKVFFSEHWSKRPYLSRGDAGRFATLFDTMNFNSVFLDQAFGPAVPGAMGFVEQAAADIKALLVVDGQQAETAIPPHLVGSLFKAGHTIAMYNLRSLSLKAFENEITRDLEGLHPTKVNFSLYLSPDGSGFNTHFDDHSVFFLQLSGKKKWMVSDRPAMASPPFNVVASMLSIPRYVEQMKNFRLAIEPPDQCGMIEHTLQPGDVMYLPPGTWHRASAIGHSLHLTLRFYGTRFARIMQSVIGSRLLSDQHWRDEIPGSIESANNLTPELRSFFEARLDDARKHLAEMTVERLFIAWKGLQCEGMEDAVRVINSI